MNIITTNEGRLPLIPPALQPLVDGVWRREQWEDRVAAAALRNPAEALGLLLIGGATLFYSVERGRNPRMKSWWDAFYYITTCASVGYADIFAATDAGKAIASVVFTFGPALCAKVFDRHNVEAENVNVPASTQPVLDRLDAILAALQKR